MEENAVSKKPFQGFRKAFHVAASSMFPLAYLYLPAEMGPESCRRALLAVSGTVFAASFLLDVLRLGDREFNSRFMAFFSHFIRRHEETRFNGSTFLCLAFFVVMLVFSRNVAITAMFFLSLGDAAAEIWGNRFGKMKIFGKSLEGTAAFFLVAFVIAYALLGSWPVALIGAFCGALVELLSFEIDDNLTVPIGSAIALWVCIFVIKL